MNRSQHAILVVALLAVLALLLGLTETASAAFNHAATEPHYGNFLLWESEASGFSAYEIADLTKENGEWIYDGALGVPGYVRQNPWTKFDLEGLFGLEIASSMTFFSPQVINAQAKAAVVMAPIAVGFAATIMTGGAAAPYVASAASSLGLSSTTAMVTTAAVAGASGGSASQMTSNVLTGQPVMENVPKAAGTGAVLNMGGAVLGQTVQGFNLGVREGTAIATAKELATRTAVGGAPGGAANAMVTAEGQIFTGLSKNAGGGAVSPSVSGLYGSARTTCAEGRTLTAMEQAGVNPQGAVSASASVNIPLKAAGTPMPACGQACAPVLKNAGVGDAVAGTSPTLAPVRPAVPVPPTTEDEKK